MSNAIYTEVSVVDDYHGLALPNRELHFTTRLGHQLHSDTAPSCSEFKDSGVMSLQLWHKRGVRHRCGGPAEVGYTDKGRLWFQVWKVNGNPHCEGDLPAEVYYEHHDGTAHVAHRSWFINGRLHRDKKPARLRYHSQSEQPMFAVWYQDGRVSRENGPAKVQYTVFGVVLRELLFFRDWEPQACVGSGYE